MLYSETGRLNQAKRELEQALDLLEQSSPDASADIDVASTHTNLALLLLQMDRYWASDAIQHAQKALTIYVPGIWNIVRIMLRRWPAMRRPAIWPAACRMRFPAMSMR